MQRLLLLVFLVLPLAGCEQPVPTSADAAPPAGPHPDRTPAQEAAPQQRSAGIDWPDFLGPHHDSKSPETGILTNWGEDGPPIVWQTDLGTGYGICSIADGCCYQFDRIEDEARLRCLNARTGEQLWEFKYPTQYEDFYGYNNGPRASPVIDGKHVYLYGAEGMLHCLNTNDGSLVWKVDTVARFGVVQNFFGVGSTPVVEGDLLIVQVGGSPPDAQPVSSGLTSSNGTGVVAFDKHTGEVTYKLGDELASYSSPVLATIGGRRWCFLFARGGLLGFNPVDGSLDFHFPWRANVLESVNAANPVVVGNRVFISETYGPGSALLEVAPGDSKLVWKDDERLRDKAMQAHWNTPIYIDGFVYGCSGRHSNNADLRCIKFETGEVQWTTDRIRMGDRLEPLARSSLLYVDGHFVCLTEYGTLVLLKVNPNKFEPVASVTLQRNDDEVVDPRQKRLLRYPAWAAPVLSHGLMYVRGDDKLVCLELIPREE